MTGVSTAPARRTSDVGLPPQGSAFDSPSGELEDESDMTSPPTLEPTVLRRKLVIEMIEEQERDEFPEATHLSHNERLLEQP